MNDTDMSVSRRVAFTGTLNAGLAGAALAGSALTPSAAVAAPTVTGIGDFAFQTGHWHVRHRKLATRLAGASDWMSFDGTCRAWEVMEGAGNVEDQVLNDPAGRYPAAAMRMRDPATGLWSIWWYDPRFSELSPPVTGRFENGVGTFTGTDSLNGRAILIRFIWSEIGRDHARWEQAFSPDGGKSWETNWIMEFDRISG